MAIGGIEYDFTETPSPQTRPTTDIDAKHSSHTFGYKQRLLRRPVIEPSLSTLSWVPGQPNLDWSLLKLQDSGNQNLCEVCTVSLTHGRGLGIGDSGSLVIDEETQEAYGHVIAVDPMGRIFVIPLVDTLGQIRSLFGTMDVDIFSKDWSMLPDRLLTPPNPYDSTRWYKLGF
ncbi:hypothetical protein F5Y00DRAFT_261434 [Daldinia vernicosa]|uniref:uncharacterized protein n=1 Tax=Daldinia vernicosa TaxID=114800 RepID=UPI0020087DDD|nr:uncharacterized protein F5Y00DRAFT_261434 [Daldinia vernicosa]KAI0849648.1 hypothetical protein F5Y00DRAFT_261434 [Daldinia vernicosa]